MDDPADSAADLTAGRLTTDRLPVERRVRSYGPHAVLVELDAEDVAGFCAAALAAQRLGEFDAAAEVVPAACTVLLDGISDPAAVSAAALGWELADRRPAAAVTVEVPTVYDGDDLAAVARAWGMTTAEAVATHTGLSHRVAFLGFAPGFAYLDGLPAELAVERRATPRPVVPVGAVALAGTRSAVYPVASPGGWQLIGRTALRVWDVAADPPALLTPGTRVQFVAVPAAEADADPGRR